MIVRPLEPRDLAAWTKFRQGLWPDTDPQSLAEECAAYFSAKPVAHLVFASEENGVLAGMVEVGLRSVAESCTSSPVPFIEAWFVAPEVRRRGHGRALIDAVEAWARAHGFTELASDAQLSNTLSHQAHGRLGFQEVERLVAFRKQL